MGEEEEEERTQPLSNLYGMGAHTHTHTHTHTHLSLAFSSGIPKEISRSKRPERRNAGSRLSGLVVAPIRSTLGPSSLLWRSIGRERGREG